MLVALLLLHQVVAMGYLLKEALKTLCGVNQWSYAVFWKIGYQNPKLLIWEECYYESASFSRNPGTSGNGNQEIAFQDFNASWVSTGTCNIQSNNVQARDRLHLLVNKMMTDNHVLIVGEGLVGRVAFTGNHQWILSENCYGEAHPPEVLKEACQQFSAGMKTIAVIPVLPHGVVQFGSYSTIMENMEFVNDVISLVLQLGHVPGILLSDKYSSKELAPKIGVPVCLESSAPGELFLESNMISASSLIADSFNYVGSSVHTSALDCQTSYSLATEVQNDLKSSVTVFEAPDSSLTHLKHHDYNQEAKVAPIVKLGVSSPNQIIDGVVKAEVIPSNSEIWMKQHASLYIPRSTHDLPLSSSSSLNHGSIRCPEQKFLSGSGCKGPFSSPNVSSGILMSVRTNSNLISSSNEAAPVTFPSAEVNELCEGAPQNMKTTTDINSFSDANRSVNEGITSKHSASSGLRNVNLSKMEASFSDSFDNLTTNSLLGYNSGSQHHHLDKKFAQNEFFAFNEEIERNIIQANNIPLSQQNEHLNMAGLIPSFVEGDRKHKFESQSHLVNDVGYNDPCIQPQSGDDLFDILGADFKNKLFSSCWNSCLSNESTPNIQNPDKNKFSSRKSLASLEMYTSSQGNSDSGIFSTGTDHLLDAVVSNVNPIANQSLDDSVSCRTTLTNMSSSSAPNDLLPYGRFSVSNQMKGELFGVPKYLAKGGAMSSCSLRTGSSKEDSGTYSQSSSIYESQISSWIETGQNAKRSNSLSTGCSKKPDERCKTNRKRLKPGENPRPRPKDRQMIQDRVKELREIVPNGAKCSIDALLERTIKHMLFLQSVTKHADKLKQTGESKIINKDGSLLLKDNFEGGATWAYEVGSQSMVCPIIVEDLNQPRQMLVEMLCEERGLFLEIADIIRGLGLTILKGVMETRTDKIWARFTVEANRDVTRMEIFISLVQLLEQSANNDIPQSINISNDNPMVQQFHQAASHPVTGISHSLHRSNQ